MTARIVVAGTHSGVGKTSVTVGLMAALVARGLRVAPFKVGPDFIDPSYHRLATGRVGRNVDLVLSGPALLAPLLRHGALHADVAVVEGVMGLFDGASRPVEDAAPEGPPLRGDPGSTAHVARLLDAPVVLVVDAGAMAGSVAALVHGYATFDPALRIAGVIANRVAGERHAALLAAALEPLGTPLLGWLPPDDRFGIPSRHLGLVPAVERHREARDAVAHLSHAVAAGVDLDAVLALAGDAPKLTQAPWSPEGAVAVAHAGRTRIAVAAGAAFSFTYPENLELLEAAGAELSFFDPLRDVWEPDEVGGLYLGGGFPETYAEALADNGHVRQAVRSGVGSGLPVLAECGGYLYLCRELDGQPMCGVLPATARLTSRPAIGYRQADALTTSPFWHAGERTRGHVFHHSRVDTTGNAPPAWRLDDRSDGMVLGSVHASYLHTHWAATPHVAERFVHAASAVRRLAQPRPRCVADTTDG